MPNDIALFADTIISELKALGDPVRAEGINRYFKEKINSIGVGMVPFQELEKRLCKDLKTKWSIDEVIALCDILLSHKVFEVTQFAFTLLQSFANQIGEPEFIRCEKWLQDDLCDNWASVDTLCPHVLSTALRNHPEFITRVKGWTASDNRWVRRASAVILIVPVRKGEFMEEVYWVAETLFQDKKDDLVQKANGWMLREAGKLDPDRLEKFLLNHGPSIPRTTLRYAIEKYPKEKRAELLAATKSA